MVQTALLIGMLAIAVAQSVALLLAASTLDIAGLQVVTSPYGVLELVAGCAVAYTLLRRPRSPLSVTVLLLLSVTAVLGLMAVAFDLWGLLAGTACGVLFAGAALIGGRRTSGNIPWSTVAAGLGCAALCVALLLYEAPRRPLTTAPVVVAFATAESGLATDSSGTALGSEDGGETWQASPPLSELEIVWSTFLDGGQGWAFTTSRRILSSPDAGQTWQARGVPSADALMAASFLDARNGWVLAADGAVLASRDGGVVWSTSRAPVEGENLFDLAFGDAGTGWVVGSRGRPGSATDKGLVIRTPDGGAHWEVRVLPASGAPRAVAAMGAKSAWVTCVGGTILATKDGGVRWSRQVADAQLDLLAVEFLDEQHGWVAGSGVILYTEDGGDHWLPGRVPTEVALRHISFVDAERGWASGDGGTILSTVDGGGTWQFQATATRWRQ